MDASTEEAARLYAEGRSLSDVAAIVGTPRDTLRCRFLRVGVRLRERAEAVRIARSKVAAWHDASAAQLRALYVEEGMSLEDVGRRVGVSRGTLKRALLHHGIPLRGPYEATRVRCGARNAARTGIKRGPLTEEHRAAQREGKRRWADAHSRGFTVRPRGDHIFTRGPNKGRPVHTVLVEEAIGRRIRGGEHVHHIDGDPKNNALSNLMLLSRGEHTALHNWWRKVLANRSKNGD